MILGKVCTRACGFCNVEKATPSQIDFTEPRRIADAVKSLNLSYVVITSVTRDDLFDGGASVFVETINAIRSSLPQCRIELLIPDLKGSGTALQTILDANPDVLSHNIETVPSLYPSVRPEANYKRSLDILAMTAEYGVTAKSGIMLGLGEGRDEILSVMHDLRASGCSILTLGQYLQPRKANIPVDRYYHPDEFDEYQREALRLGFSFVAAGPLVRSSYQAGLSRLPPHTSKN